MWGDETGAVHAAISWANRRTVAPSDPKTTARDAADLAADIGPTITSDGIGYQRALQIFDELAAPATRAQDDPYNLAFIPAAPTRAAIAFDTAVSSANIFGGMWDAGSGAIFLENQALSWLISLLGWPQSAGGCFVAGGTIGNLSALVAARTAAELAGKTRPEAGWQIACSAEAHSSVAQAARVMGCGVVNIPTDQRGHVTGSAVGQVLADNPGVMAVVASAGTTNAGLIDDLADIAPVCARHGVWLHVDGAYGGAALASAHARAKFAGIELADSFIVDPHKWLFAPYDCCALIYRDAHLAAQAHTQRAAYLDAIDRQQYNPADLAIHMSRRVRGLPLWYSLATHGTAAYGQAIDRCLATAAKTAAGIAKLPHLELVSAPELSVLLFRRKGWQPEQYYQWSAAMAREGVILIIPTTHRDECVFRLVIVNPETSAERILQVLDTQLA